MQTGRMTIRVALCSIALIGLGIWATGAALGGVPPKDALQAIRVLYLQGVPPEEAQKQLRTSVGIAAISAFEHPPALVIRDLPEQVERAEALLREKGAVGRAVDPHPPIVLLRMPEARTDERTLRFTDVEHAEKAHLVLRAIFGAKQVAPTGGSGLVVRDVAVVLEASEALFRELGFLAATP